MAPADVIWEIWKIQVRIMTGKILLVQIQRIVSNLPAETCFWFFCPPLTLWVLWSGIRLWLVNCYETGIWSIMFRRFISVELIEILYKRWISNELFTKNSSEIHLLHIATSNSSEIHILNYLFFFENNISKICLRTVINV